MQSRAEPLRIGYRLARSGFDDSEFEFELVLTVTRTPPWQKRSNSTVTAAARRRAFSSTPSGLPAARTGASRPGPAERAAALIGDEKPAGGDAGADVSATATELERPPVWRLFRARSPEKSSPASTSDSRTGSRSMSSTRRGMGNCKSDRSLKRSANFPKRIPSRMSRAKLQ